jgi:hypothetical protein
MLLNFAVTQSQLFIVHFGLKWRNLVTLTCLRDHTLTLPLFLYYGCLSISCFASILLSEICINFNNEQDVAVNSVRWPEAGLRPETSEVGRLLLS